MKPTLLVCDTCSHSVLELSATPEQRILLKPLLPNENLMLRRRVAAESWKKNPRNSLKGNYSCPQCGIITRILTEEEKAELEKQNVGGGGGEEKWD